METVLVHIAVKEDRVDDFIKCTNENVKNSIMESGILRFELLQNAAETTKFILLEVYKNKEATVLHKETRHYRIWRDEVVDMMAEPRQGVWYKNLSTEN